MPTSPPQVTHFRLAVAGKQYHSDNLMFRKEVTHERTAFPPRLIEEAQGRSVLSIDQKNALHAGRLGRQLRCHPGGPVRNLFPACKLDQHIAQRTAQPMTRPFGNRGNRFERQTFLGRGIENGGGKRTLRVLLGELPDSAIARAQSSAQSTSVKAGLADVSVLVLSKIVVRHRGVCSKMAGFLMMARLAATEDDGTPDRGRWHWRLDGGSWRGFRHGGESNPLSVWNFAAGVWVPNR
jgi:hypothetical protein